MIAHLYLSIRYITRVHCATIRCITRVHCATIRCIVLHGLSKYHWSQFAGPSLSVSELKIALYDVMRMICQLLFSKLSSVNIIHDDLIIFSDELFELFSPGKSSPAKPSDCVRYNSSKAART